ncbi:hypothetical protein [Sphingobium sp. AEW013]|uniref:hypothetical protein n=1 Tax=Sphingobium sp. AEW013 TaxID=2572915 RepID=UPI0011A36274|nr:hypothetical protein [Sphingobium sp. AEW013]
MRHDVLRQSWRRCGRSIANEKVSYRRGSNYQPDGYADLQPAERAATKIITAFDAITGLYLYRIVGEWLTGS